MIASISDGSLVGTMVLTYEDGNKEGSDVGGAGGTRLGCTDGALPGNAESSEEGMLVGALVREFDGGDVTRADGIGLGCSEEAGV